MGRVDHSFKAMGGPAHLRFETRGTAEAIVAAVVAEVERLEQKYSRYREDSLTSAINRSAGSGEVIAVDEETVGLLNYADTLWRESSGLFDLTSGVLRRVWDFKSAHLPEQSAIEAVMPLVGWAKVQRVEDTIALPLEGMELDFGGCVKEYAADSAAAVLRQHGVAWALVDLAGDMVAIGVPPGSDGWPVGIRHPGAKQHAIANVTMPEGA